ncbi:MAG: hypothetical protein N2554_07360, partial [Fimbriimonadales bacterium]|nr:hypothetical protein [Fimbriimonadales bacterium]
MRTLCIWGLLLLVNLSWAQGLDVQSDPRLSQPVSLRVAAAPLHQLLRQLERQSGVELRVEQNLREYRAFARLQSRPLHQTLRLLADAFALEWRAEPVSDAENAPLRYVLYQPEAERKREAEYRAVLGMDITELTREALKLIPPDLLERSYEDFCALMGLTLDASSRYPYAKGTLRPQVSLPKPAETQGARTQALLAARHRLLEDAARTPEGLLTLRMLATLTDAKWRDLRTKGCLRLSPDRLPPVWRRQWEQDCVRLHGYTIEEVEQYQPSKTNPNVVYTGIDTLPSLKAVLKGDYYFDCLYDARTMQLKAHQTIYTSDSASMPGLIALDGLHLLQAITTADKSHAFETPDWLAQTPDYPIQRITEKVWAEAIPRQWVDSLSFHIFEGLQSAGAEGIGEFYPLSVGVAEGKARWRELLQELILFYTLERREGVWL